LEFVSARHGADHACQVFKIHLVTNTGVRRNDLKVLERRLSPAEKRVALDVALEFQFRVEAESVWAAERIHLYGVVDHQFGGKEWIDALGIAAHPLQRFSHRGEIDHCGNAGEILQQDARGHECDFFLCRTGSPTGESLDVFGMDEAVVLKAKQILQKNPQRK